MKEKSTLKDVANNYLTHTVREKGITLIALIVTVLFSYDEKLKCSNSKGFLLTTI